jgi:hypothetical protein
MLGGKALCPEIQNESFFILPKMDAINEIIEAGLHKRDGEHGASPSRTNLVPILLMGFLGFQLYNGPDKNQAAIAP